MKKNRQILYVILFLLAVGVMALYGRSSTEQYSEEKVINYVNSMRIAIQDIYSKVPIDDLKEEKFLSDKQLHQLNESTDRLFSSYIELKTLGTTFDFFEEKATETEAILENVYSSLYEIDGDTKLSDAQIAAFAEYYQFLWDVYELDMYNMDVGEILTVFENISAEHLELANMTF